MMEEKKNSLFFLPSQVLLAKVEKGEELSFFPSFLFPLGFALFYLVLLGAPDVTVQLLKQSLKHKIAKPGVEMS